MRFGLLAAAGALAFGLVAAPANAAEECTPELVETKGKKLDELILKNPGLADRVTEVVAEVEKDYGGEPPEEKRCEAMDKLLAGLEKIADLPGSVDQAPETPCTEEKIEELGTALEKFITDNPDLAEKGEGVFAEVEKEYGGEPPEDKVCEAMTKVIAALNALTEDAGAATKEDADEAASDAGDCDEAGRASRQAALGEYLKANPEKTSKMEGAVAAVEADYGGEPPLEKQCEALDKLLTILQED